VPDKATQLNARIMALFRGIRDMESPRDYILTIVTDVLEDLDDTALFLLLLRMQGSGLQIHLVLSGGLKDPSERLAFLQTIVPDLEFGKPFNGYLTVFPDGYTTNEVYDGLLVAGPMCTETRRSLFKNLEYGGHAVIVGALADGTVDPLKISPIDTRHTDTPGTLTPCQADWNQDVLLCINQYANVMGLEPEVGRQTRAPLILDEITSHPAYKQQALLAKLLVLTSRPPPSQIRLNDANGSVAIHWPTPPHDDEGLAHGAEVVKAYYDLAKSTMSETDVVETMRGASFMIMNATARGARYLPGKFGSATKTFTDFLEPSSIDRVASTLHDCAVPLYDVAGFVMLLEALKIPF